MTNGRLVVLGSCGGWPQADRACSGFVIEHEGLRVVLDLGYGTLPRLFALTGSSVGEGIDAVVVTHGHPDHVVDLHGLFRARWFGQPNAPAVPLYAPEGVIAQIARLEDADAATVRRVFDWHPLPAGPYRIGPVPLDRWAVPPYFAQCRGPGHGAWPRGGLQRRHRTRPGPSRARAQCRPVFARGNQPRPAIRRPMGAGRAPVAPLSAASR